jgi:hypothetical protein
MLPVDEAQIESLQMSDIGLRKSICVKKQLGEFEPSKTVKVKEG